MRYIFATLALLIPVLTIWAWQSSSNKDDQVWDVVFMGIPNSLNPQDVEVSTVGYLLNQTHRPLFYKNQDGVYRSDLLSKIAQDQSGLNLSLCVREQIQLGSSRLLQSSDLHSFISRRTSELNLKVDIESNGQCLLLKFKELHHDFFDIFSKMENAPSWNFGDSFDEGLGDFYVSKSNSDYIELTRKSENKRGFNKIMVHAYVNQGALESLISSRRIEDLNRISAELVPKYIRETYASYEVALLQTGILLLNIKNDELRRLIYNCLNISDFRIAFSPGQAFFKDIKTILPIGVPGAQSGKPDQHCNLNGASPKRFGKVSFWNWKDNNREQLKQFLDHFSSKIGIEIEYQEVAPERLFSIVKHDEQKHELIVIGLSANEFHYRDFYQYLLDPKHTILSKIPIDFRKEIDLLDARPSLRLQSELIQKLDSALFEKAVALPLFQQIRPFFYPKELKGLEFGSNFLAHPIVSEITN